jgi:hypothetical protein
MLIDNVSYTTSQITTIQTVNVGSFSVNGTRIWSCNPGNENAIPNNQLLNLTNNGISYGALSPLYDHTVSIANGGTGSNQLLFLNGQYQSAGSGNASYYTSSSQNGYCDFTSYYYNANMLNTSNYYANVTFGSSTYRYATFAWKIDNLTSIQTMTFTINGVAQSGNMTTINSNSFKLYYRLENTNTSPLNTITTLNTY